MAEFDINKVQGNDRFIAGGAAALIILSFLPWYSVSFSFGGVSRGDSTTMWHIYGLLKLAWFLAVAAGALVIARLAGALDSVKLPAGINLITLGLSGIATAIFVLRLFDSYHSGGGASAHPGFGWYVSILVSGAMTYFAFLSFKSSGEQLPSRPVTS